MTDVETKLRVGLIALAEDVRPVVPDVRNLGGVATPRRRRRLAMAGVVVGSVVLAGTAAAAGFAPRPVQAVFEEITGWNWLDGTVDPLAAELVATTTFEGTTYQYWSTGPDVPRCEYLRIIRDGEPENGSKYCTDGGQGEYAFGDDDLYVDQSGGAGQMTLAGHAPPDAAFVVLTYGDGSVWRVPVQGNGFFVAARLWNEGEPWRSVVAYDTDGTLLRRFDF